MDRLLKDIVSTAKKYGRVELVAKYSYKNKNTKTQNTNRELFNLIPYLKFLI